MILGHVERFVDHLGDRFDFRTQFLLDPMKSESGSREKIEVIRVTRAFGQGQ